MSVKLVYFAWVRERIGLAHEHIDLPDAVSTVSDLVEWLAKRGDGYAYALENPLTIRVAIDQQLAQPDDPISGASEIALFPPMTGG